MPETGSRTASSPNPNKTIQRILLAAVVVLACGLPVRSYLKNTAATPEYRLSDILINGDAAAVVRLMDQKVNLSGRRNGQNNIWDMIASPPSSTDPAARQSMVDNKIKVVKAMLEHGADPNSRCSNGDPVIVRTHNQPEIITVLLEHGANANAHDIYNNTSVLVNYIDDAGTMQRLIGAGADIHAKGYGGVTPLFRAIEAREVPAVELLLDKGARVSDRAPSDDAPPLHYAADMGNVEMTALLIQHGADIRAVDKTGSTALLRAALMNNGVNLNQIPRFIGADPERRSKLAQTIRRISEASETDKTQIKARSGQAIPTKIISGAASYDKTAAFLLGKGADPNLANRKGWTPLLAATANDNLSMVKTLLAHGANTRQTLPGGITALQIAQAYGYREIEDVLRTK